MLTAAHLNGCAAAWFRACKKKKSTFGRNSCATVSMPVPGLNKKARVSPKSASVAARLCCRQFRLTHCISAYIVFTAADATSCKQGAGSCAAAELWVGHNPKQMPTITEMSRVCCWGSSSSASYIRRSTRKWTVAGQRDTAIAASIYVLFSFVVTR